MLDRILVVSNLKMCVREVEASLEILAIKLYGPGVFLYCALEISFRAVSDCACIEPLRVMHAVRVLWVHGSDLDTRLLKFVTSKWEKRIGRSERTSDE